MSIAVLTALRDAISADTALNDFFSDRYQKSLSHLIGYDKGSPNAKDRPLLCYVPVQRKFDTATQTWLGIASIVMQIIEKETTDGIRDGVRQIEFAADKVVAFLANQPSASFTLHSDFAVVSDLGRQHPFYEIEITFKYRYRMQT